MASNRYKLIVSSNSNQPESPQIFPPMDSSPLDSQRDPLKETQAVDEDNISPLITMRTDNPTDREDAGLPSKPAEAPQEKPPQAEAATKRAPRKRFYSHTPVKPTPIVTDTQVPAGRLDTFQNEAESIGVKIEDNESPILKDPSDLKRDSTKPLRPSRFRKTSYDFRGSLETSDEDSPGRRQSNLSDLLENRPKKLGSSANSLIRKVAMTSAKPPSTSLTFDAFVDKRKGIESIKTNYPTYKTDKRLIFLGKRFKYPTFVIPSKSLFRKFWNAFIILIILYQVFWHPLDNTFLIDIVTPRPIIIIEWLLLLVFLTDIGINIRTTYSNENNEEIIDLKMIRRHYMKKIDFIYDIITLFPLAEILFYSFPNGEKRRLLYSVPKLLTFLRIYKLKRYQKSLSLNSLLKVMRIFIAFFLMVHWASCLWYLVVKNQYYDTDDTEIIWYPNNLRMIAEGPEDLLRYYHDMDIPEIYAYTMLAIFMLVVGSDNAPVNQVQVYITVVIGLLGAMSLAYVFGLVTYIINRSNESVSEYEHQLEGLKKKLKANKIPTNLRIKVLEYYNYTWRKHRILHKLNDFSELSIPLQRDLAFYQNQKLVTKVPLFQELEPLEVLSIIQKLKTCVYMPGDKIIREGERGTEMYFIQEGVVEIIVKVMNPNLHYLQTPTFQKTYLGKESYFGEIALMSNSKRTSDANAFEFCILESFSRSDYNSLKKEFPDIGPRLKSGLKYYKSHRKDKLMGLLKSIPIFDGVTESELKLLIDDYTEELFIDPNKIILRPKEKTNALYFVFLGHVCCYADHPDTRDYLIQLKRAGQGDKAPMIEEDDELDCLDDNIHDLEKDKTSIDDQKKKLKLVKAFTEGGYFGNLDFGENQIACEYFYVSDSGCQIGAITQELLEELMEDNIGLYEKLRNNQFKHYPKTTMQAIQEEAESVMSISVRNNIPSIIPRRSLKHIKDSLNKLDMHKVVPGSVNGSATHLEEEFANFKGQFGKMQLDVDTLNFTMNSINYKLSKLLAMNDIKETKKPTSSLGLRRRNSLTVDCAPIHLFDQTRRSKPSIEEASEGCEESPSYPKPQQL